jgi:hypothetical protein
VNTAFDDVETPSEPVRRVFESLCVEEDYHVVEGVLRDVSRHDEVARLAVLVLGRE